jgi:subtilisin family serine protease
MTRYTVLTIYAALIALIAGCSGGAQPQLPPADRDVAALASPQDALDTSAIVMSFTPEVLTRPEASGMLAGSIAPGSGPLIQHAGYARAAAELAARYGLTRSVEVYAGHVAMARFELPADADGEALLAQLRADYAGQADYIGYDVMLQPCWQPNDTFYDPAHEYYQWYLDTLNMPQAWDITRGSNDVLLAVIDTGARLTHDDLQPGVLDPQVHFPAHNLDIVNNDNTVEDLVGHGTAIAGTMVGTSDNGQGIASVAPDCRVVPIKIMHDSGGAPAAYIVAGIMLAIELDCDIISFSYRMYADVPQIADAVQSVADAGIPFFVAAGNDGEDGDFDYGNTTAYPAGYATTISVAGTTDTDARWSHSNRDPMVDISAPGWSITTTANTGDDWFNAYSGTSFSCPIAAAVAGLMLTVDPELTPEDIRSILVETGAPTTGFPAGLDAPRVDALAALERVAEAIVDPWLTGISVAENAVGSVPGTGSLLVAPTGYQDLARVEYTVDLYDSDRDFTRTATTGPYNLTLELNTSGLPNHIGEVRAVGYAADDTPTLTVSTEFYVYNVPGDTNADGAINAADLLPIEQHIGAQSGGPGFVPFWDCDNNGVVNEADAAVVGYNWD